jgi:hypothetical protein
MLVRFLRDFQSAATGETFYEAGQTADLIRGAEVVAEGAAVAVPLIAREGQAQPKAPEAQPVKRGKQNR